MNQYRNDEFTNREFDNQWLLGFFFFILIFFPPKNLLQCRKEKKKKQQTNKEIKQKDSLPGWAGCTFLVWMLAKDFSVLERSSLCESTWNGSKIRSNLISSTSCQFSQTLFRQGALMGFVCGRQMHYLQSVHKIIKVPCLGNLRLSKPREIIMCCCWFFCTRSGKAQERGI